MVLRYAKIALCKGGDRLPDAKKLRLRMSDLKLSQREVSTKMGIAQPTLSQKLNGVRPFYLEEAEKLAYILEIPDSDFGLYFFHEDLRSAKNGKG